MFKIELGRVSVMLGDWDEVEKHPWFLLGDVYRREPFGWVAI